MTSSRRSLRRCARRTVTPSRCSRSAKRASAISPTISRGRPTCGWESRSRIGGLCIEPTLEFRGWCPRPRRRQQPRLQGRAAIEAGPTIAGRGCPALLADCEYDTPRLRPTVQPGPCPHPPSVRQAFDPCRAGREGQRQSCFGGHGVLPKEQNTQQSPCAGRRRSPQPVQT